MKGARGTNECPSGYFEIADEEGCKLAASALAMSYVQQGSFAGSPKGCLTSEWDGRGVFYNTHTTGNAHSDQARICIYGSTPLRKT